MKHFWTEADDKRLLFHLNHEEKSFSVIMSDIRNNAVHKDRTARAVWSRLLRLAKTANVSVPGELHVSYLKSDAYLNERSPGTVETVAVSQSNATPTLLERRIKALVEAFMAGVLDEKEFVSKILKFVE